jgi:glutamate synthase (ferredoxin)
VLERLEDAAEIEEIRLMVHRHAQYTRSQRAFKVLALWEEMAPKFVKVIPKDYKRMLQCMRRVEQTGLTGEEAVMAAFEENARDVARVGGS